MPAGGLIERKKDTLQDHPVTYPNPTCDIGPVLRAYVYAPDFHFARASVSRAGKQVSIRTEAYR